MSDFRDLQKSKSRAPIEHHHTVEFRPSGRGKAQCDSDPAYPNGIAVSYAKPGQLSCLVKLPYPAPECGMWMVGCDDCSLAVMITAAGRPDDPISVNMACQV